MAKKKAAEEENKFLKRVAGCHRGDPARHSGVGAASPEAREEGPGEEVHSGQGNVRPQAPAGGASQAQERGEGEEAQGGD